jgi:hypothetical protein
MLMTPPVLPLIPPPASFLEREHNVFQFQIKKVSAHAPFSIFYRPSQATDTKNIIFITGCLT